MLYSVIDTKTGEEYGIKPFLHHLLEKGAKMVVNENELRKVDADIEKACKILGGTLLTEGETIDIVNKDKS